jgi:hypothetical protein
METCLYVLDIKARNDRLGLRLDPGAVRCRKDGLVFCKPCLERFENDEDGPYAIKRDKLAQMVAAHTSGLHDAIAEQEDFIIADELLALLESRLSI